MVEYSRQVMIKSDIQTIYQKCIEHFMGLGYHLISSSEPSYIEFEKEGATFAAYRFYTANHKLIINIITQHNGAVATFNFSCPWILAYIDKKSRDIIDGYISTLLTKIYQSSTEAKPSKRRRLCPSCKKDIPWDAVFCPYCGHDFTGKKKEHKTRPTKCPKCGKPINKEWKMCAYCGSEIEA